MPIFKKTSDRSFLNGDDQRGVLVYDSANDKLIHLVADTNGYVKVDISAQSLTNLEVGQVDQARLYGYDDENERWVPVITDLILGNLVTMSLEHHKVHEGHLFNAYRSDTLASGDSIWIALTTPDSTTEHHLDWTVDVGGECSLDIIEDVESYTGGTDFTPVNRNRRSNNTSTITTCKVGSNGNETDGLSLTGGTTINERKVSSGKTSSAEITRREWILKRNSITVVRLTAVTNNISCGVRVYWYEVTPS